MLQLLQVLGSQKNSFANDFKERNPNKFTDYIYFYFSHISVICDTLCGRMLTEGSHAHVFIVHFFIICDGFPL